MSPVRLESRIGLSWYWMRRLPSGLAMSSGARKSELALYSKPEAAERRHQELRGNRALCVGARPACGHLTAQAVVRPRKRRLGADVGRQSRLAALLLRRFLGNS